MRSTQVYPAGYGKFIAQNHVKEMVLLPDIKLSKISGNQNLPHVPTIIVFKLRLLDQKEKRPLSKSLKLALSLA